MIKILSREGLRLYADAVKNLRDFPSSTMPVDLLNDADTSIQLPIQSELPELENPLKYELAEALIPIIDEIRATELDEELWPCVWDGLALHYFSEICPRTDSGLWRPNKSEHYCFDDDFRKRHRHRINGPVTLMRNGGEVLRGIMSTAPSTLGDFEEQVGSRQELSGNPIVLRVLSLLYTDSTSGKPKRGYTTTRKYPRHKRKLPSPGTLRRFVAVHLQYSRTFDLFGISSEALTELLPTEFDRWKVAK